ncbi:MAG: cell division protein FtsQ/DivIB [Lentibacter algarum]|uniref:cell division protein FtsQ/DivIB n=1 Tax=Lentibacter algarum TaxID=576131 RepID=UPI003BAED0DA
MPEMRAPRHMNKSDPAPSRWNYRYQRLMLTPLFRRVLRVGVPFTLALGVGLIYFANEARRDGFNLAVAEMRAEFENRPEFMVKLMAIDGATVELAEDIREIVPLDFPLSSFELDLETIRQDVAGLQAVKTARVKIKSGGILQIDIEERQPVAVWRTSQGLELLDAEGVAFRALDSRFERADLPLIAGDGASQALAEAMQILAVSAPLQDRLRGVARIGDRRWDVVLDRDQRIMLPEERPVQALQRVLALNTARDLLGRDVTVVDMRVAHRPTIRMSEAATRERWKARATEVKVEEQ